MFAFICLVSGKIYVHSHTLLEEVETTLLIVAIVEYKERNVVVVVGDEIQ